VTSSVAVFEAAIRVKSIVYDEIVIENKKEQIGKRNTFLQKPPPKRWFRNRIR